MLRLWHRYLIFRALCRWRPPAGVAHAVLFDPASGAYQVRLEGCCHASVVTFCRPVVARDLGPALDFAARMLVNDLAAAHAQAADCGAELERAGAAFEQGVMRAAKGWNGD